MVQAPGWGGGRGQLWDEGRGLWSLRVPSHRHLLILLQGLMSGGASPGQAAGADPPQERGRPLEDGVPGDAWPALSEPQAGQEPLEVQPSWACRPLGPGPGGPPGPSPSPAPREGRCGCEGPARSEQRPRARVCRRVRTWHGCFQPCVYDNGGEELSAETLTQPGTSGVGARWGRRGGVQRGTEGWRRRRGAGAGTGRASQQERPGEGNTHSNRHTQARTRAHTQHRGGLAPTRSPTQARGPGRSEMSDKSSLLC